MFDSAFLWTYLPKFLTRVCLVASVPVCLVAFFNLNLRHAKTGYCYKAWNGGHNQ
jgi:hypothetical protein